MNTDEWNTQVLKQQGIKYSGKSPKISRNVGDLQKATLEDGTIVRRQELIFVDGHGLIRTAPYELHFIYEAPVTRKGWGLWCTCGSIAGVVGYAAYTKLATPSGDGKLIVCVRHTTLKNNVGIGQHADGSTE